MNGEGTAWQNGNHNTKHGEVLEGAAHCQVIGNGTSQKAQEKEQKEKYSVHLVD